MQPPAVQPSAAPGVDARQALNLPGIFLMVLAGLSFLYALFGLFGGAEMIAEQLAKSGLVPPEMRDMLSNAKANQNQGINRALELLAIVMDGLVFFGAMQMRNLKMYGLGIAASFIVMIPCFTSCCCFPGLGVGIWALVVLFKPEVKSAFT